jgi:AcrR family transcriptional regulator
LSDTPTYFAAKTGTPTRIDGRHLRSERTRRLIADAYMALIRENVQPPTAVEIADRAGYSVRSIFERFPDLDALRIAAADFAIAEEKIQGPSDGEASPATRIESHVEARASSCERWLPLWRVIATNAHESRQLQQRIKTIQQLNVMRLETTFKPELSMLSDIERRQTLLAIEAITDFESWSRMIDFFGLSRSEACIVWKQAIERLLPAAASPPEFLDALGAEA